MNSEHTVITPKEVLEIMTAKDNYTRWLGLEVLQIGQGHCKLKYTVREDMLNGFGNIHGGVLFSASDSAFAFSCNSHGIMTVALDVSITFTRPAKAGEVLIVEAIEMHLGRRTALYDIRTTNEAGELVCYFKGTSYSTSTIISK